MTKNRPHPNERIRALKQTTLKPEPLKQTKLERSQPPRVSRLDDLGALRETLKTDAAQRARKRAVAAQAAHDKAADAHLFRQQIGAFTPLKSEPRALHPRPHPSALPLQTRRDEQAVLDEAISDEFTPHTLLDTDEALSYCRPGVSQDVARKLWRGHWVVQAQLDLHGMRRDEARSALTVFLREATAHGLRCVRVIHGKGLGSVGKEPVLKNKVRRWLSQTEHVMAFCQTPPHDGGSGAVLVLLRGKLP